MLNELMENILTEAGLEKNKTFKKVRFLKVPKTDFVVWSERSTIDGSDFENLTAEISVTAEVYTYSPNDSLTELIFEQLDKRGIHYETSEKIWLNDEQYFVTYIYFNRKEKRYARH